MVEEYKEIAYTNQCEVKIVKLYIIVLYIAFFTMASFNYSNLPPKNDFSDLFSVFETLKT